MTNTDTVAEAGQPAFAQPDPEDTESVFYYPEERLGLSNAVIPGRRTLSQIVAEKVRLAYDRREAEYAERNANRPPRAKREMLQVEPANGRKRVMNIDGADITELCEVANTSWIRGRIRDGSLTLVEAPVRETLVEQEQPQVEQQPQETAAPYTYSAAE